MEACIDTQATAAAGMDLSSDGKVVVAGDCSGNGEVKVYDVESGKTLHSMLGTKTEVYGVKISADGALAATAGGSPDIHIWNLESGRLVAQLARPPLASGEVFQGIFALAFSPDGRTLVASGPATDPIQVSSCVSIAASVRTHPCC
jgi:WD40 repeat protein